MPSVRPSSMEADKAPSANSSLTSWREMMGAMGRIRPGPLQPHSELRRPLEPWRFSTNIARALSSGPLFRPFGVPCLSEAPIRAEEKSVGGTWGHCRERGPGKGCTWGRVSQGRSDRSAGKWGHLKAPRPGRDIFPRPLGLWIVCDDLDL